MINSQHLLPLIEVPPIVYELIQSRALLALPIHCHRGVAPGNLICFQALDDWDILDETRWIYAITRSTEYHRHGLTFTERVSFLLTRFDIVEDLSDLVIS